MSKAFENEILRNMEKLTAEQQEKALAYIKSLLGMERASQNLLQFAGAIDKQSIHEMTDAIKSGCENIDKNEW